MVLAKRRIWLPKRLLSKMLRQVVSAKWEGSVQELLNAKIPHAMAHPQFQMDVVRSRCRKSQGRERADVQHRYSTSQVRDRVHR